MTETPLVAILDYGIGNLRSAQKSFEHAGADARLTADRGLISDADGVVLPGVGAFAPCMGALQRTGLDDAVHEAVESGRPFMGICVGMQVLFAGSDEAPGTRGLGLFDRRVTWIPGSVKRPQMQWNVLARRGPAHRMFNGLDDPIWAYFVHSLAPEMGDGTDVVATCDYGGAVVAAVARGNVWAAQFHPEKSSRAGLCILANFAAEASSYRHGRSAGQRILADFLAWADDRGVSKPADLRSAGQPLDGNAGDSQTAGEPAG